MEKRNLFMVGGLIVAIIFVILGVLWLGYANETLDVLAHMLGASEWQLWIPPFPDYEIPGMEGVTLSTFLLGIAFIGIVMGATFGIMWLLMRLRSKTKWNTNNNDDA
ncbi:MAG: hypothetical protein ACFFD8_05955 [Candidatus Thorarchaeota archaeon]